MSHRQTLGKCCYCGQKTLIQSQELNCGSCGAPLTKFLSLDALKTPSSPQIAQVTKKAKTKLKSAKPHKKHTPNRKKHKGGIRKMFDLIDDIVDIFD